MQVVFNLNFTVAVQCLPHVLSDLPNWSILSRSRGL